MSNTLPDFISEKECEELSLRIKEENFVPLLRDILRIDKGEEAKQILADRDEEILAKTREIVRLAAIVVGADKDKRTHKIEALDTTVGDYIVALGLDPERHVGPIEEFTEDLLKAMEDTKQAHRQGRKKLKKRGKDHPDYVTDDRYEDLKRLAREKIFGTITELGWKKRQPDEQQVERLVDSAINVVKFAGMASSGRAREGLDAEIGIYADELGGIYPGSYAEHRPRFEEAAGVLVGAVRLLKQEHERSQPDTGKGRA